MPNPAYHPLVRSLARGLRRRCGVSEGDRLLLAVSGGADSVALLRATALVAPRRTWRLHLTVGHVQHHLRDDAEDDAQFVAELSQRMRLPFLRRDVQIMSPTGHETPAPHLHAGLRAGDAPMNVEARGRESRYAALRQMAAEAGCRFIVTAHHSDDQIETILMRLMRGTGVAGLRGIAWRRKLAADATLIRPMLATTHAEALDFLRQLEQPWREDHTNADVTRTRARLRRDVLPVLRDLRPSVARKAVELGDTMRRVQAKLDATRRMEPRD